MLYCIVMLYRIVILYRITMLYRIMVNCPDSNSNSKNSSLHLFYCQQSTMFSTDLS